MSFASAARTFARQAARERQPLSQARVQPYTGADYKTVDGSPVDVFLSAVRGVQEITENGVSIVKKAQLRVAKTCRWQPAEGKEFVNTVTSERFRCSTGAGTDNDFAAEVVCDVVKISA